MIWIYRIIFLPLLVISLPFYIRRMLKRGGYKEDFKHRFGVLPKLIKKDPEIKRIWIQAVSVGELQAIEELVKELVKDPMVDVIITTTTSTGYKLAKEKYANIAKLVAIFPLDFWFFTQRAWKRINPDVIVLIESELWPEHLHQAKKRNIPAILINARMSDRSYNRYSKVKFFAKGLLRSFNAISASNEQDRKRLLGLGASPITTITTGNIKFDTAKDELLNKDAANCLLQEMGFINKDEPKPIVLLGSSTWPGEEEMLLEAYLAAKSNGLDVKLLIVPRHAERSKEVADILNKYPVKWHRRSESKKSPGVVDVYMGDTTGELKMLSQVADLAFIGKSLAPNEGGQTPIEVAALGIPMVYGPMMKNFKEVCRSLEKAQASIKGRDADSVIQILVQLLFDESKRKHLGYNAKVWHQSNCGSSVRTAKILFKALNNKKRQKIQCLTE